MAVKTFTTGEVLTASDTNAYLANSGLVYIKEQAFNASSFNFTSIFSATYDVYRIVVNLDSHSGTATNISSQMLSGTTPFTGSSYAYAGTEQPYSTGVITPYSSGGTTRIIVGRVQGDGASNSFIFDIANPFRTLRTMYQSRYIDAAYTGQVGGMLNNAVSYDGLNIVNNNASTITGTAYCYGYRKA